MNKITDQIDEESIKSLFPINLTEDTYHKSGLSKHRKTLFWQKKSPYLGIKTHKSRWPLGTWEVEYSAYEFKKLKEKIDICNNIETYTKREDENWWDWEI